MAPKVIEEVRNWLWPRLREGDLDAATIVPEAPQAPPHAFVIDDEEGICKFISMTLDKLGIESESFPTAGQAILALERRIPDIIFLDIALKRSDAVDVLRGLGETDYKGVIQLMSGTNTELLEDVRRVGTRHGLNLLPPLTKPFRSEAIRKALASAHLDHGTAAGGERERVDTIDLDEALKNKWLELWYQPKIDLRTKTLAGAEGLIRCRHPVRGMLAPSAFLPEASERSLLELTEFVTVNALHDWDEFASAGVPLHTAVNTDVKTLANLPLAALIREHRPRNEQWPGLILEVTEGDVVKDVALVHEIATQLRIYNVTFAIDDFGEGYSSFARLREFPFGELKLDRSFVNNCATDAKNAGICRAIIELAHHFGALAVAEGLENAADLQAVHRLGCDLGQGYFLARPMPKAQFVTLLRQRGMQKQAS
jgi:EAL domain-containing protein (putative c-di-GMP-specific phosphodiesterase class I)/CheY-like chemotaxis protein